MELQVKRTLQQIKKDAEAVLERAATSASSDVPTMQEVTQAADIMRLIDTHYVTQKFVAEAHIDNYEDYLKERGLI